jgi:hypothetical protein
MADKTSGWVATWRTVQKYDAASWKKVRENAPMRTARWAAAIAVVAVRWAVAGTPASAVAWIPPIVIVLLLILPDAESVGLGAFTYKAQKQADRLESEREKAEDVAQVLSAGAQAGAAVTSAAQARTEAAVPAGGNLRRSLGLERPSTGEGPGE